MSVSLDTVRLAISNPALEWFLPLYTRDLEISRSIVTNICSHQGVMFTLKVNKNVNIVLQNTDSFTPAVNIIMERDYPFFVFNNSFHCCNNINTMSQYSFGCQGTQKIKKYVKLYNKNVYKISTFKFKKDTLFPRRKSNYK